MSVTKTLATVIERPGEAAFREVILTPRRDDTVICKTLMSAISTGTDMKTYHGLQHPDQKSYSSSLMETQIKLIEKQLMDQRYFGV